MLLAVVLVLGALGCGKRHRRMRRMAPSAASSATQSSEADATAGERIFADYGCVACHTIDGARLVGPPLDRIAGQTRTFLDGSTGTVTADYVRESIVSPSAKVVSGYASEMPSYERELDDAQIDDLVAYVLSLR